MDTLDSWVEPPAPPNGLCFFHSSFRFQPYESYDSRPCLPEHNPYRPSYSYDYDFDLGTDRNGSFGGQYSDCRDPVRERGSLDSFMRGRGQSQGQGQGRFQDRSNSSTFMRNDHFMPPSASSEPLSVSWNELNYVGGRGLGGPSPSRPPPSLFSQSMAPDYGIMGMQGAGSYDNTMPYGCGRSQTRIRDRVSTKFCQVFLAFLLTSSTEVKFMYCKSHSFEVYNSTFSKFTDLYSYHNFVLEYFCQPKVKPLPVSSHSLFPPPGPDNHSSASCLCGLASSGHFISVESHMWPFVSIFFH